MSILLHWWRWEVPKRVDRTRLQYFKDPFSLAEKRLGPLQIFRQWVLVLILSRSMAVAVLIQRPHQHTVGNQVSLLLRWAPSTALQDLASVAPVEVWVAVAKHTGWPWGAPNCRARWLKLLIALMSRGKHADPRRLWNSGGCILGFSESEAHRN